MENSASTKESTTLCNPSSSAWDVKKIGKFMKQKSPKSTLLEQHTTVDNNKTNKVGRKVVRGKDSTLSRPSKLGYEDESWPKRSGDLRPVPPLYRPWKSEGIIGDYKGGKETRKQFAPTVLVKIQCNALLNCSLFPTFSWKATTARAKPAISPRTMFLFQLREPTGGECENAKPKQSKLTGIVYKNL